MLGVVRSLQGVSFGEIRSFSLAFLAPGAQIRCKQFPFFISRFQSCNIICCRIVKKATKFGLAVFEGNGLSF